MIEIKGVIDAIANKLGNNVKVSSTIRGALERFLLLSRQDFVGPVGPKGSDGVSGSSDRLTDESGTVLLQGLDSNVLITSELNEFQAEANFGANVAESANIGVGDSMNIAVNGDINIDTEAALNLTTGDALDLNINRSINLTSQEDVNIDSLVTNIGHGSITIEGQDHAKMTASDGVTRATMFVNAAGDLSLTSNRTIEITTSGSGAVGTINMMGESDVTISTYDGNGNSSRVIFRPNGEAEVVANGGLLLLQGSGVKCVGLKTGISQVNAGAATNELWVDTADQTIKIGL